MPDIYASGRRRCVHECACGELHICGDYDRCTIGHTNDPYVCPACEHQALDDYLTTLEQKEPHHADHRQGQ